MGNGHVVLIDTNSKVGNFAFSALRDPSSRLSQYIDLFPPYYVIPLVDVLNIKDKGEPEMVKNSTGILEYHLLDEVQVGRALFTTMCCDGSQKPDARYIEALDLARSKFCRDPGNVTAALPYAIMSCKWGLRYTNTDLNSQLVHSHLSFITYISPDRSVVCAEYKGEPLLLQVASEQMLQIDNETQASYLLMLAQKLVESVESRSCILPANGSTGEMGAMILMCLVMDMTRKYDLNSTSFTSPIPLKPFLLRLTNGDLPEFEDELGGFNESLLGRSFVSFAGTTSLASNIKITPELLLAAWEHRIAFKTSPGHVGTDLVIPVAVIPEGASGPVSAVSMTAIVVQVKNYAYISPKTIDDACWGLRKAKAYTRFSPMLGLVLQVGQGMIPSERESTDEMQWLKSSVEMEEIRCDSANYPKTDTIHKPPYLVNRLFVPTKTQKSRKRQMMTPKIVQYFKIPVMVKSIREIGDGLLEGNANAMSDAVALDGLSNKFPDLSKILEKIIEFVGIAGEETAVAIASHAVESYKGRKKERDEFTKFVFPLTDFLCGRKGIEDHTVRDFMKVREVVEKKK